MRNSVTSKANKSPKTLDMWWQDAANALNLNSHHNACLVEIKRVYSEPHRHWHNLNHLTAMLSCLQQLHNPSNPMLVMAIFYHDFIYVTGAANNESLSAIAASNALTQCGCQPNIIAEVQALINSTKTHELPSCENAALLFDLDQAVLGSDREIYMQYTNSIRREHVKYPQFIYRIFRKKFLKKKLQTERIFFTDYFFNTLEQPARNNLTHELNSL